MRFMVIVPADANSEAGKMPDEKGFADMMKYNEELVKAGVMLSGDGLHPSSRGARIKFSGSKRTVVDGPFTEAKELIAGFWIWQVKSREEAIEWAKRAPFADGVTLELRQVFEPTELPASPETKALGEKLRSDIAKRDPAKR
jgi:hypothetical protein